MEPQRPNAGPQDMAVVMALATILSALIFTACQQTPAFSAVSTPARAPTISIPLALLSPPTPNGESDQLLGELAKALESTPGLQLLDRDHVRKVLEEHRLTLANVVREPLKPGQMLGAKYLLYLEQEQNATVLTRAMICIEVGSGNVVWERVIAPGDVAGTADVETLALSLASDLRARLVLTQA